MPRSAPSDPTRRTLLLILGQLNQAEASYDGQPDQQALELGEIERRMRSAAPPGEPTPITTSLAVGLLLRNRLVQVVRRSSAAVARDRSNAPLYRITTEGKRMLAESVRTEDRIR